MVKIFSKFKKITSKKKGLYVKYDLNTRMFWSAICSVISVQFIIIWFIITSLEESKEADIRSDNLFKKEKNE